MLSTWKYFRKFIHSEIFNTPSFPSSPPSHSYSLSSSPIPSLPRFTPSSSFTLLFLSHPSFFLHPSFSPLISLPLPLSSCLFSLPPHTLFSFPFSRPHPPLFLHSHLYPEECKRKKNSPSVYMIGDTRAKDRKKYTLQCLSAILLFTSQSWVTCF